MVAGLCHDLGHGPFSHSWETFVNTARKNKKGKTKNCKKGKTKNCKKGKTIENEEIFKHEDMSLKLFEKIWKNNNVRKELDQLLAKNPEEGVYAKDANDAAFFVKELINGFDKYRKSKRTKYYMDEGRMYFHEIISNKGTGIDVDKWDYLLRDCQQLNLKLSFDSQRLMQCLRICDVDVGNDKQYHICYRDKEMDNILQMYIMRGELHKKAAQHRVVRCIDRMWIDALMEAESSYKFHGRPLSEAHMDLDVYEKLNDNIFYDLLYPSDKNENKSTQELLERIVNRDLYRFILSETVDVKYKKGDIKERKKEIIDDFLEDVDGIVRKYKKDIIVTSYSLYMHDLPNNVYLYKKKEEKGEKLKKELWRSALLFPIQFDEMIRIEVFFYDKEGTKGTEETERLKHHVKVIMEVIERNIDHAVLANGKKCYMTQINEELATKLK